MRTAAAAVKPSLTIQRRLNAAPARVYAAWTEAEKIARWFGPSVVEQDTVRARMDVRVGGTFQVSFKTDDGQYHQVGGIYREVIPNKKLVFSWAWHTTPERESLVTVTIKAEGDRTLLTLLHEQLFDEAARTSHTRGWTGSIDKLEAMFA
jgi:uncharacterized protein YndB with AHSA1/START domain